MTTSLKAVLTLLALAAAAQAPADEIHYLHTDILGNVVLVTDQDRNVVERRVYEPYGLPEAPVPDGPGFTGHDMDGDSGLVYMQQRYYDPQVGRFLSVDPMAVDTANAFNFNRYDYAAGNPYRYTDPDGRESGCIHAASCGDFSRVDAQSAGVILDFTPVVGDVKGIADAIADPSAVNITAAVVGMVPGIGDAAAKGIKAGADAIKATSKIDRNAFRKEREAFWKAEAQNNPGMYGTDDLAKMEKGRAPTGPDGHPMELHHVDGTPEGGVTPMSRTDHRLGENYKRNHPDRDDVR